MNSVILIPVVALTVYVMGLSSLVAANASGMTPPQFFISTALILLVPAALGFFIGLTSNDHDTQ